MDIKSMNLYSALANYSVATNASLDETADYFQQWPEYVDIACYCEYKLLTGAAESAVQISTYHYY
jgi:hypothetical protein